MTSKFNRQWRLAARPVGLIQETDFEWREEPIPAPGEGQILIRNLYLSLDPTNRGWMSQSAGYIQPVAIGEVMRGIAIGVVVQSRHPQIPEGRLVQGMLGWQDYALSDSSGLTLLPEDPDFSPAKYFGLFGHIGLTAYVGLLDIGKPRPGDTLVVSAAAGAVGSLVGQIGKIKGCRVVGIAGREEKCRWLKEELGFDATINYRTEDVFEGLKKHCPDGIDVDFENVGGEILDTILRLINLRGRIVICGLISQYNAKQPLPGPYHFGRILIKRVRVEGFLVLDHLNRAEAAFHEMTQWHNQGRLKYRVDVVEGLENAPGAVNKLFDGSNQGKLVVKL